jgi:hypothetical protein
LTCPKPILFRSCDLDMKNFLHMEFYVCYKHTSSLIYDCILLHVFTNNLRNGTPEQCVKICDEYISALSSHCKFAKIIKCISNVFMY